MKKLNTYVLTLLTAAAMLFALPAHAVTTTYNMQALGAVAGGQYVAKSGTTYTADAAGVVTGVAPGDVTDMLKSGLSLVDQSSPFAASLYGNPGPMVVSGTAAIASVNAGVTIIPAVTGKTIYVTNLTAKAVGGTLATCTDIVFQDTAASPIGAIDFTSAGALSGTGDLSWNSSTATVGAAFGSAGLTASKGLAIVKSGSNCVTATGIRYAVTYVVQ